MEKLHRHRAPIASPFGISLYYPASLLLALLVFPVLIWQGRRVRKRVIRLPGAVGSPEGWAGVANGRPPLRLLVLGESTVAGIGASTHAVGMAGRTAAHLAELLERPVWWTALGKNGVTAQSARFALAPQLFGQSYDLVVVALGANDTFRLHPPSHWANSLAALIKTLRGSLGPVPILLATVPPVAKFPAIPQPLRGVLGLCAQALGHRAQQLAAFYGLVYYSKAEFGQDPSYFCSDGIHPSEKAYQLWGLHLASDLAVIVQAQRLGQDDIGPLA